MRTVNNPQTMATAYAEICQRVPPWTALGNFMNAWFDYAKDRRAQLVADPLPEVQRPDMSDKCRWAVFCAASVEWLCERYGVPCPAWVHHPGYHLPEPWFDSPGAHKPQVREWLLKETPEPFTLRNIYCGNRMFLNKYELAEQWRQYKASLSASTPTQASL